MTDADVITPDLASVRGYRSEPYPRSSSSLAESVIGAKQTIPVRVRPAPQFESEEISEPEWLMPVIERLTEIVSLPRGWDSYDAQPIRIENVEMVLRALVAVMGDDSDLPWIVPLPSGGVQLEWHNDGSDIEISLEGDDSSILIDDEEIPHGIGRWPSALDEIRRRLSA